MFETETGTVRRLSSFDALDMLTEEVSRHYGLIIRPGYFGDMEGDDPRALSLIVDIEGSRLKAFKRYIRRIFPNTPWLIGEIYRGTFQGRGDYVYKRYSVVITLNSYKDLIQAFKGTEQTILTGGGIW